MNTYPQFKDSGVDWLGKIPAHWIASSLKRVATIQTGLTLGKVYDGLLVERPYLRVANVQDGHLDLEDFTTIEVPPAVATRVELQPGDVLMTEGGDLDKLGRGVLWNAEIEGCLHQNHIFALRCFRHKLIPQFLVYLSSSQYGRDYFEATGKRTTNLASTSATKVGTFPVPLPPLPEQECIAAYLDASCAAIDAAVDAKRRQLETLEALRKATLTRVLTLGIKSGVRTSPSGQDWLGNIPQHWSPLCLKRLLREPLTYGLNEAAELEDRDLPRYLRITDFDDSGTLRDDTYRSLPWEIACEALLQPNDVLFARSGATVGKTFIFRNYTGTACFAGYLIRARTMPWKLNAEFLYLFTKTLAYEAWKSLIFTQATIQNISAAKYNYLTIPVPPLPEQQAIVAYAWDKETEFRTLSEQIERQISTLLAYRKSLIHECVTGQRRVP